MYTQHAQNRPYRNAALEVEYNVINHTSRVFCLSKLSFNGLHHSVTTACTDCLYEPPRSSMNNEL